MKNTYLALIVGVFLVVGNYGSAACTPDPTTSRTVGVPSSIQTAISTLNAKLSIPLKIGKQGVTVTASLSPSLSITEEDCKDTETCGKCGTYDTGSGTISGNITTSGNLGSKSFGPLTASIWGYTLSLDAGVDLNATASSTPNSALTCSRACSATDFTYSSTGSFTYSITVSGSGSGSATLTDSDNKTIYSAAITANLDAGASYSGTYSVSKTDVSGSITGSSYSATLSAAVGDYGTASFSVSL